jgi:hypothetical protein
MHIQLALAPEHCHNVTLALMGLTRERYQQVQCTGVQDTKLAQMKQKMQCWCGTAVVWKGWQQQRAVGHHNRCADIHMELMFVAEQRYTTHAADLAVPGGLHARALPAAAVQLRVEGRQQQQRAVAPLRNVLIWS